MDILLAHTVYKKTKANSADSAENYRDRDYDDDDHRRDRRNNHRYDDRDDDNKGQKIFSLIVWIVSSVLFGAVAAYLSWTSNTVVGHDVALKVFFAIFAFLFGVWYIISHVIHKLDLVSALKAYKGSGRSQAAPAPSDRLQSQSGGRGRRL